MNLQLKDRSESPDAQTFEYCGGGDYRRESKCAARDEVSSYVITPIFIETFCLREMIVKDLNCGLQAQSGQHPHVFISDAHRLISAVCAAINVLV